MSFQCQCQNCGDQYFAECEDSKRCPKCRTLGKRPHPEEADADKPILDDRPKNIGW